MNVIYEDNHIIVVEKPFNIPTQADDSGDMDMLSMVKEYIRVKYNKPGEAYIGLVHRLDRVAGGLMVFARTSKAASRLSEQIRNRKFEKEYMVVVEGTPSADSATLTDYLFKDNKNNMVKVVSKQSKDAKEAKLSYDLLEYREGLSLLRVNLHTGRPHQIRVQLSSRNNPIFGDGKYGSKIKNKKGIALWSYRISFEHPTKKEWMTFELLPPTIVPWDMFKVMEKI
ncbi:MAG: RluA family pseudouridine synthase [Peptostreptococcaceae bacterium]|nr:RluA family pseudouridine synthase [Peptostreptococcaceae bacterium]